MVEDVVEASLVVAVQCNDGIVIGSDGFSFSGKSTYISTRVANRLHLISPTICICSVGACGREEDELIRDLRKEIMLYERSMDEGEHWCYDRNDEITNIDNSHEEENDEIEFISKSTRKSLNALAVGSLARHLIYKKYRQAHIIVAGTGGVGKCGRREAKYAVIEILPGGTILPQVVAIAGTSADSIAPLVEQMFSATPTHTFDNSYPLDNSGQFDIQKVTPPNSLFDTKEASRKVIETMKAAEKTHPQVGGKLRLLVLRKSERSDLSFTEL